MNISRIKFKNTLCGLNGDKGIAIENTINLYVKITTLCNANCRFCEFRSNENTAFDINSFNSSLNELYSSSLKNNFNIGKIQITGGEPTLDETKLTEVIKILRGWFPEKFIGINTNGSNLNAIYNNKKYLSNVAISRHHYDDNKNREIFGSTNIPDLNDLRKFNESINDDNFIHISCNLIKGYIDSKEECAQFIHTLSNYGFNDFGFVSLMDVNDFCKQHKVDFDDIELEKYNNIEKVKTYEDCKGKCRCANFKYNENSIYARYVCNTKDNTGLICYDNGHLRSGFNGEYLN